MRERAVAGGGEKRRNGNKKVVVERKDKRLRNRKKGRVSRLVEIREEEKKE